MTRRKPEAVTKKPNAPVESKADAFKRVANYRLGKTTRRLRQFHALASTGSYEYTSEQVAYILDSLDKEVTAIEKAFSKRDNKDDVPQL